MKLQQGQTWKQGDQYFRIVHLERLEVKYKSMNDLATKEGSHHHVTKKDFCRLIKNAVLLGPTQNPGHEMPGTTVEEQPASCGPA